MLWPEKGTAIETTGGVGCVSSVFFFFAKLEKTIAETFTSFEKKIAQLRHKSIATK